MIPIAGPRPSRAGRQHEMYTVRAPARARVHALGHQFAAVACWAQGEGLPAMSVAGTVGGAAQDRTHLCARAALDLGRPLGPGPGPALALGLSLVLVLAHVLARAPRHTLPILGGAVGPDPIAGVVEAIAEMISGTAGLARLIPKIHDGRIIQLHAPAIRCAS
jgi:hypothetical protein